MKKTMIKLGLVLSMMVSFGVIGTTVQAEENNGLISTEYFKDLETGTKNIFNSALSGNRDELNDSLNFFEKKNNSNRKASDKLVAFVRSDEFKIDTTNFKTAKESTKKIIDKIMAISTGKEEKIEEKEENEVEQIIKDKGKAIPSILLLVTVLSILFLGMKLNKDKDPTENKTQKNKQKTSRNLRKNKNEDKKSFQRNNDVDLAYIKDVKNKAIAFDKNWYVKPNKN